VTVVALLAAAVGFVVQMASGVTDTPTIPPGLVAIVLAALLVAFLPGKRAPVAGPAAGLFNLVAFVLAGAVARLVQQSPASAFVGAWLMVVALVVATVAGTIAAVQNERTPPVSG
jgi:peptidoglycan/LPS O-acetylase OafA/YrhL